MNRNLSALLEGFACAVFAASTLAISLVARTPVPEPPPIALHNSHVLLSPLPGLEERGLISLILQPQNPVLWSLLIAAVAAALLHLAQRARQRFSPPARSQVSLGLTLAASWPWLVDTAPAAALTLVAAAAGLLLWGLIREVALVEHPMELTPLGLIAAWQLVGTLSTLALAVYARFGLDLDRAALLALLATSLIGARVQLRVGPNVAFSLALIWSMIGIAAAALAASFTVATGCVLGIASLAVVIVRVTT